MIKKRNRLHMAVDEDGAAILDIERGLISTLNPTGAFVWQGLERGETVDTIIANLARETGEAVLVIDGDVRKFAEELRQNDLLSQ